MNNLGLFTNKAEYYAKYRPEYAQAFIDEMAARGILGPAKTVADIGAGTGILTNQLAATGAKVFAVEPNDGMREQLARNTTGVNVLKGTAESIPMPDASVDAVFVGQAFHWFDPVAFRKECLRILKEDGVVVLVWNRKVAGDMETERKRIVNSYRHAIDTYHCSWDERENGIATFFGGAFEEIPYANDLVETRDEFIGRTLSASHALEGTDAAIDAYLADWNAYFDRFQVDGVITIRNETNAYVGRLAQ